MKLCTKITPTKFKKIDNLDWIGFVQIEKNSANNRLFQVSKNCFLLKYPEVQLMRIDFFREEYKNNTVWQKTPTKLGKKDDLDWI